MWLLFFYAVQVSEGEAEKIRKEPESGQHLAPQQSGQTPQDRDGTVCVGGADERERAGQTLSLRPAATKRKHGRLSQDHAFADQEKKQPADKTIQTVQTGKEHRFLYVQTI